MKINRSSGSLSKTDNKTIDASIEDDREVINVYIIRRVGLTNLLILLLLLSYIASNSTPIMETIEALKKAVLL